MFFEEEVPVPKKFEKLWEVISDRVVKYSDVLSRAQLVSGLKYLISQLEETIDELE